MRYDIRALSGNRATGMRTSTMVGWPETAPYQALRAAWSSIPHAAEPDLQMRLPPVGGRKQERASAA